MVVYLFVIVVYQLEAKFFIVVRIILKSVPIAIEPITLLIDIGSCMTNLFDHLELLICLILLDHLLRMTLNTLGSSAD